MTKAPLEINQDQRSGWLSLEMDAQMDETVLDQFCYSCLFSCTEQAQDVHEPIILPKTCLSELKSGICM